MLQKTKKRSMQNEENRGLLVGNMAEGIEDGIAKKLEVKMEDHKSLLQKTMAGNMVEEMNVDLVENNSLVVEKNLRWLEFREVIAEVRHEIRGAIFLSSCLLHKSPP